MADAGDGCGAGVPAEVGAGRGVGVRIISFAHTTPALLAGAKTVTRREWTDRHAAGFKAGDLVQAWDRSPRVKGAKRVGTIRLTADPVAESSADFSMADWCPEGFGWLQQNGAADVVRGIVDDWVENPRPLYVVRFELVEVTEV